MDFGDILKEWENQRGRRDTRTDSPPPSGKKANPDRVIDQIQREGNTAGLSAGPRQSKPAAVRLTQQRWLDRYGVPEAAIRPEDVNGADKRLKRRDVDLLPIDGVLDLHGMIVEAAEAALDDFFRVAEMAGWYKVLIIHGKGNHSSNGPVLATAVRRWLERRPSAGRSGPADGLNGGGGATWVLLKGDQRSR
jgi:DNA-nicking Smr family endonuclease